jgi:hypothetical protein
VEREVTPSWSGKGWRQRVAGRGSAKVERIRYANKKNRVVEDGSLESHPHLVILVSGKKINNYSIYQSRNIDSVLVLSP